MEYGITETGFVAKPYQVILEEEREAWKAAFGYDIDTSKESPEGAYIGNQVIKLANMWELLEGLWAAGDPDSASGIYLDRLVALVNVSRLAAQPTRVYTALWGDEGTTVSSGHLARLVSGELFALQGNVTLNREKLLGFTFKISEVIIGAAYSFQINGHTISYVAQADDTEAEIQQGLFDQIEGVLPGEFVAENQGADGMTIHSEIGIVPFTLFCDDAHIEIASLGALGIYQAQVPGDTFVAIGALTRIVSNVSGLDSIINYATGITGRAMESDAELRIEKNNRQKQASGNEVAIENEIKALAGVQYVKVYSNRTMAASNGRPPKSFEAIVVGGVDEEIAEAIFEKAPAGIQPFGSTVVIVQDSQGFPWEIGFSRPEQKFIWIKISFERNSEETLPVNAIEQIKDNLDSWGAANQGVGIDLIYQKLNRPIYDVSGIGLVEIRIAVTDDLTPPPDGDYSPQNVAISERQIALIDKTRIFVEEQA